MKATKFFALALAGLLAWGSVACSSDDEPNAPQKATLATPAPTASDITSDSFVVTWPAITGAGGYVLTLDNGPETSLSSGKNTFKFENLTASTAYSVKVKAVPANTEDFNESEWGSVTVTTNEPKPVIEDYEYTMSVTEAEYEYFGNGVFTVNGVPVDAHTYALAFYDYEHMAILELWLQTAEESFEGTYTVAGTLDAGTVVYGFTQNNNMYGSWYEPFVSDGSEFIWDRLVMILDGSVQIKKNADGTYDVKAEMAGYHNLVEAETEDELGISYIHAAYSGAIDEYVAAPSAAAKRIAKPADYRRLSTFADINRVAGSFNRDVR